MINRAVMIASSHAKFRQMAPGADTFFAMPHRHQQLPAQPCSSCTRYFRSLINISVPAPAFRLNGLCYRE